MMCLVMPVLDAFADGSSLRIVAGNTPWYLLSVHFLSQACVPPLQPHQPGVGGGNRDDPKSSKIQHLAETNQMWKECANNRVLA
mmetsp:Transcript_18147/g.24511  ORF Transcript_18147/g.24511 Transcript_18147/m.24511 type:complete len:84 (-) Transcript_18147:474-725(-)